MRNVVCKHVPTQLVDAFQKSIKTMDKKMNIFSYPPLLFEDSRPIDEVLDLQYGESACLRVCNDGHNLDSTMMMGSISKTDFQYR